jgi:hypothetical protein
MSARPIPPLPFTCQRNRLAAPATGSLIIFMPQVQPSNWAKKCQPVHPRIRPVLRTTAEACDLRSICFDFSLSCRTALKLKRT